MAFDTEKLPKLQSFLAHWNSGFDSNTMTQEMYDYYGGDSLVEALKKFDPNAKWKYNENTGNAGEGGPSNQGTYTLEFDPSKLPETKFGNFTNAKLSNHGALYNNDVKYDDENYGNITHYKNVKKPFDKTWTKIAPAVVTMGGPMAAGYLASMGIGGAGLTSAVTGSGLGAQAPGFLGKAIGQAVKSGPGIMKGVSEGNYSSLLKAGLGMVPGMQSIAQWLPVAQAAYGMTKRR